MNITIKDFLDYVDRRHDKLSKDSRYASPIVPIFDIAMNFDEDNWNGGDPLRDFALHLSEDLDDSDPRIESTADEVYFIKDDEGYGTSVVICAFNLKGNNKVQVINYEDDNFAIFTTKTCKMVIQWYKSRGTTENIYMLNRKQDEQDTEAFIRSILLGSNQDTADVTLPDYVDIMNDLDLHIDEFE